MTRCASHRRFSRPADRQGYTLVELIVVLGLTSFVISMAGSLLYVMLQVDRGARRTLEDSRNLARLSVQFRSDAHAALAATHAADGDVPPTDDLLRFDAAEGTTIHYTAGPARIDRLSYRGGKVVHRDSFRLAIGSTARFDTGTDNGRTLTTIVIYQDAVSAVSSSRGRNDRAPNVSPNDVDTQQFKRETIRIEASVGQDHAWLIANHP